MEDIIIHSATIVNADRTSPNQFIWIRGGAIRRTGSMDLLKQNVPEEIRLRAVMVDGSRGFFIPGMIDMHIHGVQGADAMDGTAEALETMARVLPAEGTTAFLPTTITQKSENITRALEKMAEYRAAAPENGTAEIAGAHVEGPFFEPSKAGAQPAEFIVKASVDLFERWRQASGNAVRIVSLAPEHDPGFALTAHLQRIGVTASAAHSNASKALVDEAVKKGLSHVTHLYNGMSGLHHREPGIAAAALLNPALTVEIIADGVHSHPDMVQLAYQAAGANRLCVITDSLRAKNLPDGVYDLGGQQVTVAGDKPYLPDGTIAGSMLAMDKGFRNIQAFTGCSREEAVRMTSLNAAHEIGIAERKGSIEAGKDADIVWMDESEHVQKVWCRGRLAATAEQKGGVQP
ncbi:N-acetylglucosamine-6-phosphate deacetylase [Marinococcus halophilus]|uniref:N-acetylglucosamine-6-phosphate deacetylase n=2 Tax=Marinococcus halophilus TaxID=1371 RepID=A0A510Y364_MARHA|nr:N-acetylglucosamine-6-phosphate deacetylase [Marinococcus halophilus]OZT81806.1 N-acetylglucosamine-6-phosphate deacetylase [Marinococcus halophilus]GEK57770.1 N-acetylglucosamine-6-phosphate deacetylase [Marinococcus halophilus]